MTTRRATVLFFSVLISLAACGDKDRPAVNSAPPSIFDAGYRYVDAAPTCTAMGTLCDGQTPYRCVNNARVAMEPCGGDRPFCAPGIGCLGCLPESLRCNPDRPEVPQRCATDGSRWIDQTACDSSIGPTLHRRTLRRSLRGARRRAPVPRVLVLGHADAQQPALFALSLRCGAREPAVVRGERAHFGRRPHRPHRSDPRGGRGSRHHAPVGAGPRAVQHLEPGLHRRARRALRRVSAGPIGRRAGRRVPHRGHGPRRRVSVQSIDLPADDARGPRGLLVHQRRVAAPLAALAHAALPRAHGAPLGASRPRGYSAHRVRRLHRRHRDHGRDDLGHRAPSPRVTA